MYYWYQTLDEKEQAVYREIFYGIQELQEQVNISNSGSITDIINCIKLDHPEIFWLQEAEFAIADYMGWKKLSISYRTDTETILKQQQHIEAIINPVLSGISKEADMYEKLKYIYDSILSMTEYETGSAYNQDIRSVFLNGRSVCGGYAASTQYLLNKLGIPCTTILGTIPSEENAAHAWNMVKMDEGYFFIDTTWGDTIYSDHPEVHQEVKYTYLLCDYDYIRQTHIENEALPVAVADDDIYNYYKLAGLQHDTYNSDLLKEKVVEGISNGMTLMQFSSEESYQQLKTDIEQNNILSKILSNTSIWNTNSCRYYLLDRENIIIIYF